MPALRFLLFDANVIITAHELGIWQELAKKCEVTITRTIVENEVYFWRDNAGVPHEIDLDAYINKGDIRCENVPLSQVISFSQKFGAAYLDKMDPGERESLTFLYYSKEKWLITSGDAIVFKVLGCLSLGERGISLEEMLQKIGLSRNVKRQFTKKFKESCILEGQRDGVTGMGLK